MAQESRVKKSLLNARVNLIFYFLTLALSFFSRKIFLDCLGADFVGLTGTLQNLLGFLNLAELGIGSAIGYVLYKPLFDHDETKINEIISVFGYLYRWIGFIILGAGLILACFLPFIFPDTRFDLGIIIFAYFSFLASSLIGYFANYKQTLLGADQKNYVVTAYFQTATLIKTIIQMVSAYYTGSYYLWVIIELFFGIVYSFILNWKINQVYPWLKSEVKQGKLLFKKYPEVMKYTKQLFVHRIGAFAQFQVTPILTYAFVSLQIVAYYGNYTIITDKLNLLVSNFLNSTGAGIGNLIAEGNKSKIQKVYWELMAIRFWIGSIIVFVTSQVLPAFIKLWLGSEYVLSENVLFLLLCIFFINITRGATEQFLYGYGLFSDIWAPLVEATIFIIIAIGGGHFIGLEGILLGNLISLVVIVWLWKPYYLYSRGFKIGLMNYWTNWLKYLLCTILPVIIFSLCLLCYNVEDQLSRSWIHLILYSIIITITYSIFTMCVLWICTRGMKNFISRVIKSKGIL